MPALQLPPKELAEAYVTLAKAVNTLFRLQWRACGIDEDRRGWKETVCC